MQAFFYLNGGRHLSIKKYSLLPGVRLLLVFRQRALPDYFWWMLEPVLTMGGRSVRCF